jgi:hypothetical protein
MKGYAFVLILLYFSSIRVAAAPDFSPPPKFRDSGMTLAVRGESRFSEPQIRDRDFVRVKNGEWSACRATQERAFRFSVDRGMRHPLFNGIVIDRIDVMDQKHLEEAALPKSPWSGDYWPIAKGILGARIADQIYRGLANWPERFNYITAHPLASILNQNDPAALRAVSPSEKYDLLIGDGTQGFTRQMWREGKLYYDEFGKVEEWMGICHGWAPASFMEERPLHAFDVPVEPAGDGPGVFSGERDASRTLHFYPYEIKGLLSYAWAYNSYPVRSLGARCNKKNPDVDESGHIKDPECFDLSPSDWHVTVVNSLGVFKRSIIMDATYDYEVWNQPVFSYSYEYFNPQTGKTYGNWEKAAVDRATFADDRFAKYRSPRTKSVIGIVMRVGYAIETQARVLEHETEHMDEVRWVEYAYDLELDEGHRIIGGEWYQLVHPDFVWVPEAGAKPRSRLDFEVGGVQWDKSTIPKVWAEAARREAASGNILNTIAEGLLRKSL